MTYQCPKCNKYGMEWDGRAKVLMCYYNSCNHVIRIENQKHIPSPEKISEAIEKDAKRMLNNVHTNTPGQLGLSAAGAAGT